MRQRKRKSKLHEREKEVMTSLKQVRETGKYIQFGGKENNHEDESKEISDNHFMC